MAVIQKVFREEMPEVKLIGKRYTSADRDQYGTFSAKWEEWFRNNTFEQLRCCEGIRGISDDFVGAMRMGPSGFEYWIGMLMNVTDTAPEGFDEIVIPAGPLSVCYVYGKDEGGELFSMDVCRACNKAWAEKGWAVENDAWYLERYNCPRFTTPDEKGNVVLDHCAYLSK